MATCPFCFREDHFAISQKTGLWNCLACLATGNHFTFIQEFHRQALQTTSLGDYEALAANRGLLIETLKWGQLAKSHISDGVWLIPSPNEHNKISNLYQAKPERKSNETEDTKTPSRIPSRQPPQPPSSNGHNPRRPPIAPIGRTPGNIGNNLSKTSYNIQSAGHPCTHQLYGVELIQSQHTLIICEGHWDRLALWEVFAHLAVNKGDTLSSAIGLGFHVEPAKGIGDYANDLLKEVAIVSVPGAGQFKPDWTKHLHDRHVILIFDNDPDRVVCPTCRGKPGYRAHRSTQVCPMCGGTKTTGAIINPGKDGIKKVLKEIDELGTSCRSLQKIQWNPSDPKDVRDILCL